MLKSSLKNPALRKRAGEFTADDSHFVEEAGRLAGVRYAEAFRKVVLA